jgi:hypothetical protein
MSDNVPWLRTIADNLDADYGAAVAANTLRSSAAEIEQLRTALGNTERMAATFETERDMLRAFVRDCAYDEDGCISSGMKIRAMELFHNTNNA